ncbi:Pre protein translocase subunit Sec66-domain-containing protein [Flagelloscypha sp. PMI_526]|nr:Pre protein translocase subunit Sec66-domain-containing protein [Flagelloscypha sp. PMI_526]
MASVLVPVGYLVVVFGSLLIFLNIYRKRTATKMLQPYFPSHPERNTYITLLSMSDPPASDALLKSALVRRAMTDVQRLTRLREDRPALQALLQKGSVGDDLWTSFQAAEKEIEAEIVEVIHEANSFVEGWGQLIFQTAQEMLANEKMRSVYERTADTKLELSIQYGVAAKFPTETGPTLQITAQPPPGAQKIASAVNQTQSAPAPPNLPVASPANPSNSLTPPSTAGIASDGESVGSPTSPSKKSGKKGKKRK